ncbi:MAG: glycosyltransferase, partial [Chloroflexota bacterium]|nr:glycosyltransferase [Chloroflexota bacterium]
ALAAFAAATLVGLAALYLLDTSENGRQVFYTRPTAAPDETMPLARIDPGGQALTTLMVVAALVAGVVSVAIGQLGPLIVVPAVIVGVAFIMQYRANRDQTLTVALAAASGVAAIDYAFWRIQMTNFAAWYVAIPLLLAELFGMAHMLGLQWSLWPRRRPRIRCQEDPTRRPIFILIPTVNEGRQILEETVRASITARDFYLRRYPLGRVEIVICNDGRVANAPNWQEPIEVARRLGVRCVTREVGGGAKAGNIEHARQVIGAVGDALLVVFDADQVAYHNFLVEIITPFMDSGVGWVQSGQYYRNLDNPVARWADDQQALFYQLICPGKDTLNAVFMCGTNLMVRASALDEIGGFPQDSVTEDFAASVALHARWRGVFLPQMLATGLGPLDLAGYFKQQQRWAIGTLSTLRTQWRRIFLPARGGMTIQQRLQYALGCTHYFSGARDLIYVVAPLLYVFVGVPAVKNGSLTLYLWHFLPYWVLSMSAFVYAAWKRTGWRGVVIGFASFPALVMAAISAFSGRRVGFTVTRKRREDGAGSLSTVAPHLVIWAASVVALIQNWRDGAVTQGAGFFVEVWLAYSAVMLTFVLWLAAHDAVYHIVWRLAERLHPRLRIAIAWMTWRIRPAPVMANIALGCLLWGSLAYTPLGGALQRYEAARRAPGPAPTVTVADVLRAGPYLGISGQTQEVDRDTPALERSFGASFTLVGRTMNVADPFDRGWADTLSAKHAYPMLTLQFGRLGAHGKPTLDASLPAIANGAHDADLKRLARAVRAYGKPILITMLPYADRNWSLNSAVANGSVPSDTPRAWAHVQSVFRTAGAGNVIWVWSPADPAHDQPYAPPPESIGFVAVSLTYTSPTLADDPVLISEAAANHPGKPLLVEVATVQRDASEARWLGEVASEGHLTSAQVAGLLYFDGLPGESRYQAAFTPDNQALLTLRDMLERLERLKPSALTVARARQTSPPLLFAR